MLEDETEEAYNYWSDKDFIAELAKRSPDYKNGKVKGIPWKEVKTKILNSANRNRK